VADPLLAEHQLTLSNLWRTVTTVVMVVLTWAEWVDAGRWLCLVGFQEARVTLPAATKQIHMTVGDPA